MKPYEIKGGDWAHQEATKVIDKNIGWGVDRTQLLRAMTNTLNETYDKAHAEGEEYGYANAMWSIFQKLVEISEHYGSLKKQLVEWCQGYLDDDNPTVLKSQCEL
ncbi:hypothetical protein KAR91_54910 [Candidatus Pacearchaeota archaeon]|nr:hypothetical protein [Candidatus Pacearchaeota archaeon]